MISLVLSVLFAAGIQTAPVGDLKDSDSVVTNVDESAIGDHVSVDPEKTTGVRLATVTVNDKETGIFADPDDMVRDAGAGNSEVVARSGGVTALRVVQSRTGSQRYVTVGSGAFFWLPDLDDVLIGGGDSGGGLIEGYVTGGTKVSRIAQQVVDDDPRVTGAVQLLGEDYIGVKGRLSDVEDGKLSKTDDGYVHATGTLWRIAGDAPFDRITTGRRFVDMPNGNIARISVGADLTVVYDEFHVEWRTNWVTKANIRVPLCMYVYDSIWDNNGSYYSYSSMHDDQYDNLGLPGYTWTREDSRSYYNLSSGPSNYISVDGLPYMIQTNSFWYVNFQPGSGKNKGTWRFYGKDKVCRKTVSAHLYDFIENEQDTGTYIRGVRATNLVFGASFTELFRPDVEAMPEAQNMASRSPSNPATFEEWAEHVMSYSRTRLDATSPYYGASGWFPSRIGSETYVDNIYSVTTYVGRTTAALADAVNRGYVEKSIELGGGTTRVSRVYGDLSAEAFDIVRTEETVSVELPQTITSPAGETLTKVPGSMSWTGPSNARYTGLSWSESSGWTVTGSAADDIIYADPHINTDQNEFEGYKFSNPSECSARDPLDLVVSGSMWFPCYAVWADAARQSYDHGYPVRQLGYRSYEPPYGIIGPIVGFNGGTYTGLTEFFVGDGSSGEYGTFTRTSVVTNPVVSAGRLMTDRVIGEDGNAYRCSMLELNGGLVPVFEKEEP